MESLRPSPYQIMAGGAMNRMFPLIAACLAFAGCAGPAPAPPLEGARIGGAFALTDAKGKTVRDSDFAGRWRIVYFGYTYCPDICPTDMAKIGQAMKLLDKAAPEVAAKVAPIFITVDPVRDTPKVVGEFTANFDTRFTGLTGTPEAVAAVAKKYAVYVEKQPPNKEGNYLVGHSQVAYLMDAQGKPVTPLPLDKDAAAIAGEVQRWVR